MDSKTRMHPGKAARHIIVVLLLCMALAACGGSSGKSGSAPAPPPAQLDVKTDQKLPTAPHLFDVYRSTNANNAIIFLHGFGVNKHHAAYQFGVNKSDIDSDYSTINGDLLLSNKVMAIFPQGQAVPATPQAYTWSNYVTNSGQDDMQFIRDLVSFISAQYGITHFFIVGHSTGGMLVNRIWCESPDLFDSYVAVAGPPSEHFLDQSTPCSPAEAKPYLGIVRSQDSTLGVSGNWEAQTWTINLSSLTPADAGGAFIDPVVIGERYFLPFRVAKGCGEDVKDGDASATTSGTITTWSFCGNSIKLLRDQSTSDDLEAMQKTIWQFVSPQ